MSAEQSKRCSCRESCCSAGNSSTLKQCIRLYQKVKIDAPGCDGDPVAVPVCLLKSMPFPPMAKAQAPLREGAALMLYLLLQKAPGLGGAGWSEGTFSQAFAIWCSLENMLNWNEIYQGLFPKLLQSLKLSRTYSQDNVSHKIYSKMYRSSCPSCSSGWARGTMEGQIGSSEHEAKGKTDFLKNGSMVTLETTNIIQVFMLHE